AELYAAVWILNESLNHGPEWRVQLRRLCSGRTLHRRRYAARRVVGGANGRLEVLRTRGASLGGPSCLLPLGPSTSIGPVLEEPLEQISSRLLGILALAWQVPAEEVRREMERQHEQSHQGEPPAERTGEGVVSLDGWRRRPRRRLRVDRRSRRPGAQRRGRAA
ncbi:MAG TPA: hypothetical protein VFU47_02535, partial [Armatimonadota bacterium]|nr:hypothetical protein [Armatimonadota bacterium]